MNKNQVNETCLDRVEITLRTDAKLASTELSECEAEIRSILNREGIEISDLSFREGSTIVTIGILVGSGLAFCFAQLFCGVFNRLGELGVEFLLKKADQDEDQIAPAATDHEQTPATLLPIKRITSLELSPAVSRGASLPKEAMALMMSAESAGNAFTVLARNLPGIEKSITVVATTYYPETQERVEEIYQRRISKL